MELESVLVAHGLVAEAAVVGYEHDIKGEGIAAFITASNNVDQSPDNRDLLKKYVAKEIGPFARPDQVHFTDALPKTRSGKIMRRLLKDIAAGKELKQDLTTIEDVAALHKLVEKVQAELS